MSDSLRTRWTVVELAAGVGGWPQLVGMPLAVVVIAYGVARLLGWEGVDR